MTWERLPRLLVIVPTNPLREQIGTKFVTLGLLRSLGVLPEGALHPIVGFLEHKPRTVEEVDAVFRRCNVVVTTMSVVGQCTESVQKRMAELCSHLFIDEAHHISARTWDGFRQQFLAKPIVQFTATPFCNDGKHVDGKIVFNYLLRKAQAEGISSRSTFALSMKLIATKPMPRSVVPRSASSRPTLPRFRPPRQGSLRRHCPR